MAGAAVTAEDLGMKGPRGTVFEGVTFDAPAGSLICVEGPSGAGRTCLLLALTGRMRTTTGRAAVDGHPLPKRMAAVRRLAALGPVPGVTDLEPSLTVVEHLRERALLRSYFSGWRREPRSRRLARVDAALESAGLDLDTLAKGPRTAVRDLERLEALRLGVALALLDRPRLLAVDDLDLKLSDAERDAAWALLRDLTAQGVTVLAVSSEPPSDTAGARLRTVRLGPAGRAAGADTGAAPAAGAEDADPADPAAGTGTDTRDTTSTTSTTSTDTEGDEDALAEAGRA